MEIQKIIQGQKTAIQGARDMVEHYGRGYRADKAADLLGEAGGWREAYYMERINHYRKLEQALTAGLETIRRRVPVYGTCDHCGQMASLMEVRQMALCEACDLDLITSPEAREKTA